MRKLHENRRYTKFISVIVSIIFFIIYIPLSIFGIFGCFMADNPPANSVAQTFLYIGVLISMATPIVSFFSFLYSLSLGLNERIGKRMIVLLIPFANLVLAFAFMYVSSFIATVFPT